MTCFIAMAFGRPDTDRAYDELIFPVLRERDITPVRIDRLEHNENIDDRMMASLGEADFVLADLTYARPSVYFEAGFAERQVPVIYTVRRDHLGNRADDEFGNFKVHFDLLMRNIIDWTDPDDALFPVRLGRRIDDVLVPLHAKAQETQSKQQAIKDFARLSFQQRKDAIMAVSRQVLETSPISQVTRQLDYDDQQILGTALRKDVLECCSVTFLQVAPSGSDVARCVGIPQTLDYNFGDRLAAINQLHAHYIIVSLYAISRLDVLQKLPDFRQSELGQCLFRTGTHMLPVIPMPKIPLETEKPMHYEVSSSTHRFRLFQFDPYREVQLMETLQIIDSIRSLEELKSTLLQALNDARLQQNKDFGNS